MIQKGKIVRYAQSVSTGTTIRTRLAKSADPHWAPTLEGTDADFDSTSAYQEGDQAIASTGWKEQIVNADHIDFANNVCYARMSDIYEDDGLTRNVIFRTEEYAGTAFDPYLYLWQEDESQPQRTMKGLGT